MAPFLVSREVTAFVSARRRDGFFEGRVNLLRGPTAARTEHVCLGLRDTEEEALGDARRDATALMQTAAQRALPKRFP